MGFKEIGRKIQKAREGKGMTQVDLAHCLGITQAALSNYELGKRRLYLHQIEEIAQIVGKTLDFFITDDSSAPKTKVSVDATKKKQQILSRIARMSNDELSALAYYLDFLEWRKNNGSDE